MLTEKTEQIEQIEQLLTTILLDNVSDLAKQEIKLTTAIQCLNFFDDFNDIYALLSSNIIYPHIEIFKYYAKKYDIFGNETNRILYEKFFHQGYLYHITKPENIESILDKGILSLNRKYDQNVYRDCVEINRIWREFSKGKNTINTFLIDIPQYSRLYSKRFYSTYMTTNLIDSLKYYGRRSELIETFVNNFFKELDLYETFDKETLKEYIIEALYNNFGLDHPEDSQFVSFYEKYYEPPKKGYNVLQTENKAIIMLPRHKIQKNKVNGGLYKKLVSNKTDFWKNYLNCIDLEYHGNISKEGLIAIEIERLQKNPKIKVLYK